MTQVCLPAGCVDAIRIALIDDCTDEPVPGATNGYVFNCFRALEITMNIEDGDETILRNDCGRKCFQTKKCDELNNVTVAFELLNPDYELTNLLTGQALINDGVENIGWYQRDDLLCAPWVSLEMFEQVPDENCSAGHRYRRIVIPKIRFKLPNNTREDPFRIIPFEGMSAPASIAAWGDGPYNDSPFDFSALAATIQTHYIELFDDGIVDTIEGTCGFITVPAQAPVAPILNLVYNSLTDTLELTSDQPTFATWAPGTDQITISGTSGGLFGSTGTNSATLINPSTLHIYVGTAAAGIIYGEITQVDFEQPSGTDIAIWTGSVQMPRSGVRPLNLIGGVVAPVSPTVGINPTGGRIAVVGRSSVEDGFYIVVLDSDGERDLTWSADGTDINLYGQPFANGSDSQFDTAGRLVAFGEINDGANYRSTFARYSTTGVLDGGFGTGGVFTHVGTAVRAAGMAIVPIGLPDTGKLIGLSWDSATGFGELIRVTAGGALDATFGTGGVTVTGLFASGGMRVLVDPATGDIYVQGDDDTAPGGGTVVERYTAAGVLDATYGAAGRVETSFSTGVDFLPGGVTLDAVGRLLLVGSLDSGAPYTFYVGRLDALGAPDPTFDGDGLQPAAAFPGQVGQSFGESVKVQSTGDIITAALYDDGTRTIVALSRWSSSGTLDAGFGTAGHVTFDPGFSLTDFVDMAVLADDSIVFEAQGQNGLWYTVKHTASGVLDTAFGSGL